MKFELSNHVALQHPDWRNSESYYKDVMGLDTKMEGKGKDCYMRDPYGLVFNLWEKE